jgi:hypothetical protein
MAINNRLISPNLLHVLSVPEWHCPSGTTRFQGLAQKHRPDLRGEVSRYGWSRESGKQALAVKSGGTSSVRFFFFPAQPWRIASLVEPADPASARA